MAVSNKRIFYEGNVEVDNENLNMISLTLVNIKGLNGDIEIPLKNDVFGIVGGNGCGKSTIMSMLSKLVPPYTFRLNDSDYVSASSIDFTVGDQTNAWAFNTGRSTKIDKNKEIRFYGRYEGSLFYGTRFEDSSKVDYLMLTGKITSDLLVDADDYVIKTLGYILHGNEDYYKGLKRLRNREVAKKFDINNLPYFYEVNGTIISQYRMSSGECLLISLLHFLHNSINRKSIPTNRRALLLVDEIELALHPVAVKRLIETLIELSHKSTNLTCIISSHSLEVIRSIPPSNLFNITTNISPNGERRFHIDNPIYPCYLMKDIYSHSGYDFVIMVEDVLAAKVVEKALTKLQLRASKLINVVPIGGWNNVYDLHKTFSKENTLGPSTKILSVIDGDVRSDADAKFKNLPHIFLPVPSVEKFLLYNLFAQTTIRKCIKDTIFIGEKSIDEFAKEYTDSENKKKEDCESKKEEFISDKDGKRLYRKFKHFCETERKISEDALIDIIFSIIENNVPMDEFEEFLKTALC